MEITEVRVKLMEDAGERLQAFCSITLDDAFVVRDLKIIEGATGPFVAMPSRKLTTHCPHCRCKNHLRAAFCNQCGREQREQHAMKDEDGRAKLYADIAHPINATCREMIQQRVIEAYEEELARSQQPGYVPSYVELDDDPNWVPSPAASVSGAGARVQASKFGAVGKIEMGERPRGPHRPPSSPQHGSQASDSSRRVDGRAKDGFGAGIFE